MTDAITAYRTCPLCEATCGLELTIEGGRVTGIRGDAEDVFSHGFVCPKGAALKPLHEDPDRVRTPLLRTAHGFEEVSWDEAFAEIDRRLAPILERHGRDSVGAYLGNPNAHNLDALLYGRVLLKALGTRNIFSASTVDQMPKHVSAGLMFGAPLSIPMPDVDRTDHLLMLGANPLASNGSLLTAPDMRGRLRAIRERGGRIVVVDPRRSRTAEEADEHHFIRPGTDAHLLFGIAHVLFDEGLADPGALAEHCAGLEEVRELARVLARGRRRRLRDRGRRDQAHGAGAGGGRERGGLRAHRHLHTGIRHAGQLAGGRAERPHRQPRPPRRSDVHEGSRRRRQHARHAGQGQGVPHRPLAHPRARAAGGAGRASGCLPGGGDRHAGRGPDPRAVHVCRQPGRQHARTPDA